VKGKGNGKGKKYSSTCHMGSHSVTCHPTEVTFPPLPQLIKAGTRFSDPGGMQGCVIVCDDLDLDPCDLVNITDGGCALVPVCLSVCPCVCVYVCLCVCVYTPWSIKKRATFIFSITLANIDGFS